MIELDIWCSANILLKRYKSEAVLIATKRADALLDQGDRDSCWAWIRIAKAIIELRRKSAGKSDARIQNAASSPGQELSL